MTVCDYCQETVFGDASSERKLHHKNADDWIASLRDCTICNLLLDHLRTAVIAATTTSERVPAIFNAWLVPFLNNGILQLLAKTLPIYAYDMQELTIRGQYLLSFYPQNGALGDLGIETPFGQIKQISPRSQNFILYVADSTWDTWQKV
ncbi:hypothetical protein BAUCODRAFT_306006 [Baudoinia panamericana UAMH 10762]|uniref:Uncharacterized protein n=1 Tax=Baudoinia panamericana (strain UAMH 10762) TaxID=717646 RepID=M2MKG7_BAUPA|nr:uncharacterized protein BAUCODRAFT_306006 [Baudoinia panamericana UAMH 10762]EMC91823.1 hypothetical protein BAUCODRAFT_306006 [Baudoinia panamericana UAMH 10762]